MRKFLRRDWIEMQTLAYIVAAAAVSATTPLSAASPLTVSAAVLVEQRTIAADGTVRVALAPAKRAVPGDRVVFALNYRNAGKQPIADVVFDNPVPAGIVYRAAAAGSPEPQVSVDGQAYGSLGALRVGGRPATIADITHVRWKLAAPVAPGGTGRVAFQGVLK